MSKIKNIDDNNCIDNESTLKYEIIKKIVNIIRVDPIVAGAAVANQKPIILVEDRLAYKVDQLFSTFNQISNDIKCGKLQTNKKTLVEHLESLPVHILQQFFDILDYDRCIYNLN